MILINKYSFQKDFECFEIPKKTDLNIFKKLESFHVDKKKKNTRTILKYFSNFQILKKLPCFQIVTRKNPSISKRFPELPKSHKNISLPKDSLEQPYIPL